MDAPIQYITGNDLDFTIYTEGDDIAIRSASLVESANLPSPSEMVKQKIEMYNKSHHTKRIGKEELNGRNGHHLTFDSKLESANSGTKVELWIDLEHWMVLKEVMDQKGVRTVYEVITLIEGIEPPMQLFQLELPVGVVIIDQ